MELVGALESAVAGNMVSKRFSDQPDGCNLDLSC